VGSFGAGVSPVELPEWQVGSFGAGLSPVDQRMMPPEWQVGSFGAAPMLPDSAPGSGRAGDDDRIPRTALNAHRRTRTVEMMRGVLPE
jgi:hypothetical protein